MNRVHDIAGDLALGVVAGLAGTLVMTGAQLLVERVRGEKPSNGPAKTTERLFGLRPESPAAETRLNWLVHFGYGTAWGAYRGLLDAVGVRGWPANLAFGATVQGAAYVMISPLTGAAPFWSWGAPAIAEEAFYHAIYAGVTGMTYDWLRGERPNAVAWGLLAAGVPAFLAAAPDKLRSEVPQLWAWARDRVEEIHLPERASVAVQQARQGNWRRALATAR
ncbi:MAG TPA: hypothetical protein V6D47_08235 [Oscillatoriaceae cyanobacterium]